MTCVVTNIDDSSLNIKLEVISVTDTDEHIIIVSTDGTFMVEKNDGYRIVLR